LMVVVTITVYLQFNYLTTQELGYDERNVVIIEKHGMKQSEGRVFKQELLKDSNIISAALRSGGREGTIAKVNGDKEIGFDYETIDEAYLPLYKIPVIKGRNFSTDFPSDSTRSLLVNETFAKTAGWTDPIGQEVNFWHRNEKYTVVGVVKDYHYLGLKNEIGPQLFTMKPARDFGMALVRINPNTAAESLLHIESTFKKLFPTSLYTYKYKSLENLKDYDAEAKWKQMLVFGAAFTILISCIGMFGLSVLSAEKRTKEIGIRKVLGAPVSAVVATLSIDFFRLVVIALLIAMPIAWWCSTVWLQNYPFRIELRWWMFVSAAILLITVSLITVSIHAIRAASVNPVKNLRME
jgi:putative ABC transport system permease protein